MTQVPLRDNVESMRAHLREGQYADVIALGRHVLRYYPKHIETYRLLAEASLETNDLVAAVDLFQRVLSADPENIVALVGLSIVHEQRKELEEAIWHLERAFEIQPANAELRKELLRVYAEYEGAPRDRLKLTPGGLARLYTRQGLYSQAIQEFRALLQRDPTRADIQAALAETLYRVGRKQEAAEIAQALLEKLPYCLKANLVLGALWSENGVPEAEALLQRARSLDPEHTVARELLPDHWDDAPPPMLPAMSEEAATAAPPVTPSAPKFDEGAAHDIFLLESLTPAPQPAAKAEAPSAPQAAIEAGSRPEPPVAAESHAAAAPVPPIAPIEQELGPYEPPVEPVKEQPAAAPPVEVTEEKPAPPLPPAEPPSASSTIGEPKPARRLPPSLPRIGPTIPGALDKLPAWLRGAAPPVTQGAVSAPSTTREVPGPVAAYRLGAPGSPHLEKTRPGHEAPARVTRAQAKTEPEATDLPEWLTRARQAARSGELEDNIAASSAPEEKHAWLTEATTESPPAEAATASPEWLRADSTGAPSVQSGAEAEGTLPAWLAASETEGQVEASAPGAVLPEWLSGPKEEAKPAAADASAPVPTRLQPSEPEGLLAPSTAFPDWLKAPLSGQAQPPAASPKVETPAWFAPQAPVAGATPEMETDETIPEWLREISEVAETEPVAASPSQSQPSEPVKAEPAAADLSKTEPRAETGAVPAVTEPVRPEPSAPVAELVMPAQAKVETETEPDSLLAQARALWTSGNRAGAIELYEKVLQGGPRFTAEVIADFEKSVQEPDAPMPAHRLLGDAYSMVGRFKEALDQYRIVLGK